MNIRLTASAPVLALVLSVGAARAQDMFQPNGSSEIVSCQFGESGAACSRFQGYIYVHRRDGVQVAPVASQPATDSATNGALQIPDARLGATRLYLNAGGQGEP